MPDTPPSSKNVTVSIVSHGQQALVMPLLEQLEVLCGESIAKVVLTVNKPESELVSLKRWTIPLIRVENTRRRGFGANHNSAFEHCQTDWFLVLNPDIRLDADLVSSLVACAHNDSGVLAPRIIEPGKTLPEAHRDLITPYEIFVRNQNCYAPPTKPAWLPGMFMLFRTKAYQEVEGFDEKFFMYGEDFDICARLQINGWTSQTVEHLAAQHDARRASRKNLQHMNWHAASLLKLWASRSFWAYRAIRHQQNMIAGNLKR